MPLPGFHPAVARWFGSRFDAPTAAQARGWPEIQAGRDTLIAAPTGSGKTLAAFLACVDGLVRRGLEAGLPDECVAVYVSPLKALGNDVEKNLAVPLAGIADAAFELGLALPRLRTAVRTGDTPQAQRAALLRRPPHLLLTTPESLYLLLTSARGREILRPVRTVIVDEIHALADDKRGAHLALSLERLEALTGPSLQRIGLSATQNPIEEIARFLVGTARVGADGMPDCAIVDETRHRALDLEVEIPRSELSAVASKELWGEVYDRMVELVQGHRTTLIFANTRRLVERLSHALGERLGEEAVVAHHGSLSRQRRLLAEERLKGADVKVAVATASLELGIDVGAVELVCQVGSPRSLSVGLQRIGRSGHWLGATPKGRLFPLTRDELIECAAFVRGVRAGRLDRIRVPARPLDVLAQQLTAACACDEWDEDDLFALARRAWPYATLERREFDEVVQLLSEGAAPGKSRAGAHVHRDGVRGKLRGRRGARLIALTCGGAIPDQGVYAVVKEPEGIQVGTLDEDFAIESMAGDIFLLGNSSWKVLRVEQGKVRVEDARGAPPSIPFWNGEAPGRTFELSVEVSRLREELEPKLSDPEAAVPWLAREGAMAEAGARQVVAYLAAGRAALGVVPTQRTLVAERFFDESGGMQLVVHSPFGARINRAYGLALRKCFCRTFDFELQAAATDDAVLLSLGPQHSFPLDAVFEFLSPESVTEALTQAALRAPMFRARFRWAATRALSLLRQQGGRKVPPALQRMKADDLLAAIFPAQAACQENVGGPLEPPDHPLVQEALRDCLTDAMDLEGLIALLRRLASGEIRAIACDLPEPSPLCHEILGARPHAFLDDAPLEERRARAVQTRRSLSPKDASEIGALDPAAIDEVRRQAWPEPRDADELHDALMSLVIVPEGSASGWSLWVDQLTRDRRALRIAHGIVAAEREAVARAALAGDEPALDRWLSGWLDALGPTTVGALAGRLGLPLNAVDQSLHRLEAAGKILRGRFSPGAVETEWCERGLLARIHRLTLGRLRREIEPVTTKDLFRFLLRWQHLQPGSQLAGLAGLREVVGQLQGISAPAGAWEREILPSRLARYEPAWLDQLCLSGEVAWGRLVPPGVERDGSGPVRRNAPTRAAPVSLFLRQELPWLFALAREGVKPPALPEAAAALRDLLAGRGASFVPELQLATGRLETELEGALWELVAAGEVACDGFAGLRRLIQPPHHPRHAQAIPWAGGRWSLLRPPVAVAAADAALPFARQLLRRYGLVFRDLLSREPCAPPWRELVSVYRRLEARGELRGGRFAEAFAGEQFALPEAVELLRAVRRTSGEPERVIVPGSDPLNLIGVLTPGARVPAVLGSQLLFVDGVVGVAGA
ncbi:MAG: DEAD/DEAH box helicase [Deltaproteobacteria bacterium]